MALVSLQLWTTALYVNGLTPRSKNHTVITWNGQHKGWRSTACSKVLNQSNVERKARLSDWKTRKSSWLFRLLGGKTSVWSPKYSKMLIGQTMGFLGAQTVKNPPAMWETWVWSLGWEDPLEEGKATHSNIFTWRIPKDRGAWLTTVHGVTKSQTWLSDWAEHSRVQTNIFNNVKKPVLHNHKYRTPAKECSKRSSLVSDPSCNIWKSFQCNK